MDSILSDLKGALRALLRRPAFSTIVVLTLALGLGANTAIFSVVNAVLLRPLPYADPARLTMIWESVPAKDRDHNVVSPADFLDWQRQSSAFESMAAGVDWHGSLTGDGEPEEVPLGYVTASFFPTLGVRPAIGRTFTAAEDLPKGPNVVVLGDALWRRRFGADRGIVGRTVIINGKAAEVIGVMPRGFRLDGTGAEREAQMWAPLGLDPAVDYRKEGGRYLFTVARLKPGVTLDRANLEIRTIAARIAQEHTEFNEGWSAHVVSLDDQIVGGVRRALLVLGGVVGFVLLIACANVANLQLAQAASRQREIAVRSALGASAWRLARQLLAESVVLALAGGALGLLLAYWGTAALTAIAPTAVPRMRDVTVDGQALAFTTVLSLFAGLLFGVLPALHVARGDLQDTLKSGGRGAAGGRERVRAGLVVSQVALSLVLLVGAGLMLKSFTRLQRVSPGFDAGHVLTAKLSLPSARYKEDARQVAFFQEAIGRVAALPGVRAAGAVNWLPFTGIASATDFWIDGRPLPKPGEGLVTQVRSVDAGYFKAMGIPLRRGATFTGQEKSDAPKSVVVSEALAREYFPGEDPIGRRVFMPWGDTLVAQIVGVVGDVKHAGLDSITPPTMYWAMPQFPSNFMTLVMRTDGDPMRLAASVRSTIWSLDADLPVADVKPMEVYLGDSVARRRFNATLLGSFAGLALLLAAVGLYGVVSYSVTQHTREFGIRMALGATAARVQRGVLRQSLLLAAAGVVTGLVGALALTRLLGGLLYDVSATDPTVFVGIALLLTLVAVVASYLPARRATRVDPMEALRYE